MKKTFSLFMAFVLCVAPVFLFAGCKKGDATKKEFEAIEDKIGNAYGTLNEEDMAAVDAQGSDGDDDNRLLVDESIKKSFVIDNELGDVCMARYIISDALYKDIDGDGKEEVYALGKGWVENKIAVCLYDYGKHPYPYEEKMQLISSGFFDDTLSLGFADEEDGVHLISYKETEKGEKTVLKDMGILTVNGPILEVPETSVKAATANPDMSIFRDITEDEYSFDGKEFDAGADFAYSPEGVLDIYYCADTVEKVTGAKLGSVDEKTDSLALFQIYGKTYVHLIYFPQYFKGITAKYDGGFNKLSICSDAYIKATEAQEEATTLQ